VGQPYNQPYGQKLFDRAHNISLGEIRNGDGEAFRFVTPIVYSGRTVGTVQVGVRKNELQAAAGWTRMLLVGFGALMMAVTLGLGVFAGRAVMSPLRRLNTALKEAGQGKFDFRISHKRRDEFGELFDSFNTLAESLETRADSAPAQLSQPELAIDQQANVQVTMLRAAAAAMAGEQEAANPEATRLQRPAAVGEDRS
jgi:methyl-accepting chemotaxis protein